MLLHADRQYTALADALLRSPRRERPLIRHAMADRAEEMGREATARALRRMALRPGGSAAHHGLPHPRCAEGRGVLLFVLDVERRIAAAKAREDAARLEVARREPLWVRANAS